MPMSEADAKNLQAITDELLELEERFDADMSGLRQRQEAALRRLEQAVKEAGRRKAAGNASQDD